MLKWVIEGRGKLDFQFTCNLLKVASHPQYSILLIGELIGISPLTKKQVKPKNSFLANRSFTILQPLSILWLF